MTRRTLLASALLAGCSRKLGTRYSGWLFITSAAERGIAVADLAEFRHATTISLDQMPGQVLRAGGRLFVTCPDARIMVEIDLGHFRVSRKLVFAGRIVSAAVTPDQKTIVVATEQPGTIWAVDAASFRVKKQTHLPVAPSGLDVFEGMIAVAPTSGDSIFRLALADGKILGSTQVGSRCSPIRIRRNDGKMILCGLPETKEIVTLDAATGKLLARLPLAFAPARFSFNDDGGQMFVTGTGPGPNEDTIAIVNPFQSQVDETIIAGRTPYAMAVSSTVAWNLLLVTNPGSGDLTILDIDTRRLSASVHVSGNPGEVLLTPDQEYALVIGRDSGDVSVIRLQTVRDKSVKTKPLFTVFPMIAKPLSAVIMPKEV